MELAILTTAFLTAAAVAGSVVLAFGGPIDVTLERVLTEPLAQAWARCAKFGVFVACFTSGLRVDKLSELSRLQDLGPQQGLVEVYRTVSASLIGAAEALLVLFVGIAAVHGAQRVYDTLRSPNASRGGDRHSAMSHAGRL